MENPDNGNKNKGNLKKILAILGGVFVVGFILVLFTGFLVYRLFFAHPTKRMQDLLTTNAEQKRDATTLMNGGEWKVVYTDLDENPHSGTAYGSSCSFTCTDSEAEQSGIDIRFGRSDGTDEAVCVMSSHPGYSAFASLKRGDRVRFQLSENPLQEKCRNAGMYLTVKKQ